MTQHPVFEAALRDADRISAQPDHTPCDCCGRPVYRRPESRRVQVVIEVPIEVEVLVDIRDPHSLRVMYVEASGTLSDDTLRQAAASQIDRVAQAVDAAEGDRAA